MREIEVKILEIDRKNIERKLVSLGAKKTFEGEITAILLDFDGDTIKKAKDVLRLRKIGKKSYLTFKKYVKSRKAKIRKEFEVEVSDFGETKSILECLRLSPKLSMRKRRISYELDGLHFEIDRYYDEFGFVPEFLEIESNNLKKLYKYVALLGFKKSDCKPWTIMELAEHYSK